MMKRLNEPMHARDLSQTNDKVEVRVLSKKVTKISKEQPSILPSYSQQEPFLHPKDKEPVHASSLYHTTTTVSAPRQSEAAKKNKSAWSIIFDILTFPSFFLMKMGYKQ